MDGCKHTLEALYNLRLADSLGSITMLRQHQLILQAVLLSTEQH